MPYELCCIFQFYLTGEKSREKIVEECFESMPEMDPLGTALHSRTIKAIKEKSLRNQQMVLEHKALSLKYEEQFKIATAELETRQQLRKAGVNIGILANMVATAFCKAKNISGTDFTGDGGEEILHWIGGMLDEPVGILNLIYVYSVINVWIFFIDWRKHKCEDVFCRFKENTFKEIK
jgi:hypothetical protein